MKNKNLLIVTAIAGAMLVACSQAVTPKKVSANKDYKLGALAGVDYSQKVTSQVDVLFVVDDSGSMEEEQEKLKKAIPAFISSLGNQLDVQVAVTRSWDDSNNIATNGKDRVHYFKPVKVKELNGKERDMFRGELIPVLNPQDGSVLKTNNGKGDVPLRFVRKTTTAAGFTSPDSRPNYVHLMSSHIRVGFRGFANFRIDSQDRAILKNGKIQPLQLNEGYGPQVEVLMDVAYDALDVNSRAGKLNQGFFRPGSRLVLVFLTDAPDASAYEVRHYADFFKGIAQRNVGGANASAEQLENALTVYGILPFKERCLAGESKDNGDMDPDIKGLKLPRDLKIYHLVEEVMGSKNLSKYTFDICSKESVYSEKMKQLGETIRESSSIYAKLGSGRPDDRLEVWFGRGGNPYLPNANCDKTKLNPDFKGVQLDKSGDWYYKYADGKEFIEIGLDTFESYGLNTMAGEIKLTCYYPEQKAQ
jgi:hypothetical protein